MVRQYLEHLNTLLTTSATNQVPDNATLFAVELTVPPTGGDVAAISILTVYDTSTPCKQDHPTASTCRYVSLFFACAAPIAGCRRDCRVVAYHQNSLYLLFACAAPTVGCQSPYIRDFIHEVRPDPTRPGYDSAIQLHALVNVPEVHGEERSDDIDFTPVPALQTLTVSATGETVHL